MRVVVNELAALGPKTGIGHYTAQLLRCLRAQGEDEIVTFPEGWLRRTQELFARNRVRTGGGAASTRNPTGSRSLLASARSLARTSLRRWGRTLTGWCFQASCVGKGYDVYHEPNYIPLRSDLPTVVSIHDLSVLLHPEWHPADRVAHFDRHFHRGLRHGQHFLAISESGRQEIIRTLHIPPERVTRTYMGVRPGLGPMPREQVAAVLRQLGLPPQYLLYLGTIEPRKNLPTLLEAYCGLPARLRERWPLLLVGAWGWNTGPVADFLDREGRARGVIHLGYVPEEHLAVLYNGARALVYPSLYEGFGLPPVEMHACGGAVLGSTADAVAETVGGQAHLTAPEDTDGWRQAMARVVEDDEWWQSLRRGAEQSARPFTWEKCAIDTRRAYRVAAGLSVESPLRLRAAG